MILPETQAKTARVKTIIADEPVAKPSIPSVKFAPLEIPVTIKTVIKIKTIQPYLETPLRKSWRPRMPK